MNIFVVSDEVFACADALDDKRLNKMVLETAQILSSAVIRYGGETLYRVTHSSHPCVLWAGDTRSNYVWTVNLFRALHLEYFSRNNKSHKSFEDTFLDLSSKRSVIPEGALTPFVNCSLFKENPDVYEAYKLTLKDKWSKDNPAPKWTNRNSPIWR